MDENKTQEPLSFDEMLKESTYQSEFDKRVAKALETAKTKWQSEIESKQAEAEKLAQMKEQERHQYELDKANKERDEAISKLNAYQLKEQVIKDNEDIPSSLIDLIDFKVFNTAELVNRQLETIKAVYKKSVEDGINDAFKEKSPKTVVKDTSTPTQKISRMSF